MDNNKNNKYILNKNNNILQPTQYPTEPTLTPTSNIPSSDRYPPTHSLNNPTHKLSRNPPNKPTIATQLTNKYPTHIPTQNIFHRKATPQLPTQFPTCKTPTTPTLDPTLHNRDCTETPTKPTVQPTMKNTKYENIFHESVHEKFMKNFHVFEKIYPTDISSNTTPTNNPSHENPSLTPTVTSSNPPKPTATLTNPTVTPTIPTITSIPTVTATPKLQEKDEWDDVWEELGKSPSPTPGTIHQMYFQRQKDLENGYESPELSYSSSPTPTEEIHPTFQPQNILENSKFCQNIFPTDKTAFLGTGKGLKKFFGKRVDSGKGIEAPISSHSVTVTGITAERQVLEKPTLSPTKNPFLLNKNDYSIKQPSIHPTPLTDPSTHRINSCTDPPTHYDVLQPTPNPKAKEEIDNFYNVKKFESFEKLHHGLHYENYNDILECYDILSDEELGLDDSKLSGNNHLVATGTTVSKETVVQEAMNLIEKFEILNFKKNIYFIEELFEIIGNDILEQDIEIIHGLATSLNSKLCSKDPRVCIEPSDNGKYSVKDLTLTFENFFERMKIFSSLKMEYKSIVEDDYSTFDDILEEVHESLRLLILYESIYEILDIKYPVDIYELMKLFVYRIPAEDEDEFVDDLNEFMKDKGRSLTAFGKFVSLVYDLEPFGTEEEYFGDNKGFTEEELNKKGIYFIENDENELSNIEEASEDSFESEEFKQDELVEETPGNLITDPSTIPTQPSRHPSHVPTTHFPKTFPKSFSLEPSLKPSTPTQYPSVPTLISSNSLTIPSNVQTEPTLEPTHVPTNPSTNPSNPSIVPLFPTHAPTNIIPTDSPTLTFIPTENPFPTNFSTENPTENVQSTYKKIAIDTNTHTQNGTFSNLHTHTTQYTTLFTETPTCNFSETHPFETSEFVLLSLNPIESSALEFTPTNLQEGPHFPHFSLFLTFLDELVLKKVQFVLFQVILSEFSNFLLFYDTGIRHCPYQLFDIPFLFSKNFGIRTFVSKGRSTNVYPHFNDPPDDLGNSLKV